MSPQIIFRPEAEVDLVEAYRWYEECRHGLGDDFLLCIESGLYAIQRNPTLYPIAYRQIRRTLIRRFPYGIFYITEPERIVILAVFHSKRNPEILKNRF